MAGDAPPAARHPAASRRHHDPLGPGDAAQLHGGALRLNKARMVRLAEYSRDCLRALRAATGIAYDERMRGTLQLFRTQKQFDASAGDIAVLRRAASPSSCSTAPAAFATSRRSRGVRDKFVGGLLLARRRNRRLLSSPQRLARPRRRARRRVPLRHDRSRAIERGGERDRRRRHRARADCRPMPIVVALGSYSPLLLRRSAFASRSIRSRAIRSPCRSRCRGAPESTVMDETHKVAVTRLGDRIRVGGTAELAGYTLQPARGARADARPCRQRPVPRRRRPRAGRVLVRPSADDARTARRSSARRRSANLFLATGHGTLGWTMAAGTARVIADVVSGRSAGIDLEGLTIARYRGAVRRG